MFESKLKIPFLILCAVLVLWGVGARFYQITANQFVYYDEGLYLMHGIDFLEHMQNHPAQSFQESWRYLRIAARLALQDAKFLWFFLASLRAFVIDPQAWYFTRVISAVFGVLSLGLIYIVAKRFYASRFVGLVSLLLLAIMPSHLYYSRLGLQESLSTFLFLAGFYLYLFPRKLSWQTFVSAFLFALAFFTNYRLIIIPALVFFSELFMSFAEKTKIHWRQYVWHTLGFLSVVFIVGSFYGGANTKITFAWMFYQSQLAQGHTNVFNFFSFPYYLFSLEGFLFAILFFGNFYYYLTKDYRKAFPLTLVLVQMIVFSLAQEKGVRYVCVVMPFMVMAVSSLLVDLWEKYKTSTRWMLAVAFVMLIGQQLVLDRNILFSRTDHEVAIRELKLLDPQAKILSSQFLLHKLYVKEKGDVLALPRNFKMLLFLYTQGYRYLILDPQAYISLTQSSRRFDPPLIDYLGFIDRVAVPVKVYPHLNTGFFKRFVLEHNEDLAQSMKFLKLNDNKKMGTLRIYDIGQCLALIQRLNRT